MRKLIFTILVAFLFFAPLEARTVIKHSQAFQKTITDSTIVNIYVLFPDQFGEWYISETLPTKVKGQWMRGTTFSYPLSVDLIIEPVTVSGATDSLYHYIKPLVWDEAEDEFAEIVSDIQYLKIDGPLDYVNASSLYFDWDSGVEYHVPLIPWPYGTSTVDAIYWPCAGFVVHVRFVDVTGGSLTYKLTISGVFEE